MNIEKIFMESFPGFLSIRDSKHRIVYLNENFKQWIKKYTDINPLGKTNNELSILVETNVADVFRQCHDASLDWIKNCDSNNCLKRVIPFRNTVENMQYFEVIKYSQKINGENHILTVCFDITNLYLENQRNLSASLLDPLTECYNRNFLNAQEESFFQGKKFIYIDLDNFKKLNDKYGHHEGDNILKSFTLFLKSNIEADDVVVRLGGDEFLVIINENNKYRKELRKFLNYLKRKFNEEFIKYPFLSFTYGISDYTDNIKATLRKADSTMYNKKLKNKKIATAQPAFKAP